ncbi:hypothetical protein [Nostoc sp. UHCC 0252]|uniref:hypothetical protein n=1 Tax=Nostoc sp. UHCC 0252 TaxID=3110241 RepID=UPI002B1EF4FD|nr:hypothetical protein [Nostoc sp. UHCC 0252]MEA5600147.1 hypothetical protein [Nostoc sp. UHCC 0252]
MLTPICAAPKPKTRIAIAVCKFSLRLLSISWVVRSLSAFPVSSTLGYCRLYLNQY